MCIKFNDNKLTKLEDEINNQDEKQDVDQEIKPAVMTTSLLLVFKKMKKMIKETDGIEKGLKDALIVFDIKM